MMERKQIPFYFILVGVLLLSVPSLAVNLISMNFAENTNQVFVGGELIGPLKTDSTYWNNTGANIPTGTMTNLTDKYGVPTTADVSWESKNCWYNSDGTGSDEAKLAVGYLDDGDDGPSFTVSSIPFANYSAYILFTSDQNGDYIHGTLTVNGTVILGGPFPAHGRVTDGTGWVESDGTVHGNYVKVTNLSGDLTVSTVKDAGRAPLTAFIIEEIPNTVYIENFSPAIGAIRVGQDVQLRWEVFNATGIPSFDVYLSANPDDVDPSVDPNTTAVPVATSTDTFYIPASPLDPATLYYWRIDVADDVNTVPIMGTILTFNTGGDVVDLYPPEGATGVANELTITWTGDAEGSAYIDEYAIYFGETLPETPTAIVAETQWQPPVLSDGTTYQCKVVSLHLGTSVAEATTSFTTGTLVGYWPFDDNLTDMIGSNDGTRANPLYVPGFIGDGSAADFAGDLGNDPVVVPLTNLDSTGNWTITLWEYSYDQGGGWESILGNGTDADGWGTFEFGRYNSYRYVLGFNQGGSPYNYTPDDSSYLREGWHFHVLSYNSAIHMVHWYVDGGLVQTYTGRSITLAPDLYVGNVKGHSQPFDGKVDDLKIYNKPLTAGQALQAYIDGVNGAPINPVPASGAGNIPWDVTLSWALVESPTGMTIEIGKEPDLSDATSIDLAPDATSFDVLSGLGRKLDPSSGYFWRVTATYPDKTSAGPIWFFTVRDLLSDINDDLLVTLEDVSMISAQWLSDQFEIIPADTEYVYVNQEIWGTDPNLGDYDAYVTPGGPWGTSKLSVNTSPTPADDPNNPIYTPPSQTLLWTAWGDAGQQQLCGLVFPESVNFNDFDRFGFWVYQKGCDGNMEFRPIEEGTLNRPFTKTEWGFGVNNDRWHKYEWEIGAQASANIYKVDIWVGDNEFTMEFGNFYLVKDGVEVPICLNKNLIIEDLNSDCVIGLADISILVDDWLLDASN
ncbi:MAG: LamG domain-containing protein [Sedimentisphaerales bacterium]|nr:LamG domain-containing protein [Sedimentisphaerales bacterium]